MCVCVCPNRYPFLLWGPDPWSSWPGFHMRVGRAGELAAPLPHNEPEPPAYGERQYSTQTHTHTHTHTERERGADTHEAHRLIVGGRHNTHTHARACSLLVFSKRIYMKRTTLCGVCSLHTYTRPAVRSAPGNRTGTGETGSGPWCVCVCACVRVCVCHPQVVYTTSSYQQSSSQ